VLIRDLFPKTAAEDARNYVDDEMIEDYDEEQFSDQQCFEMAYVSPKASPALTSRARPCPRACNLGRATLCRGNGTRGAQSSADDKRRKGSPVDNFKGTTRNEEVSRAMKAAWREGQTPKTALRGSPALTSGVLPHSRACTLGGAARRE
jgi:hypothetical protein